jgi:hypothetical protein
VSRDALYLRHILDAIKKIERYAEVGHDEFMAESLRHDAVIRQIEVTGEAAPAGGWRSVFGRARPEDVEEIDEIVAEEFEHVNLDTSRDSGCPPGMNSR